MVYHQAIKLLVPQVERLTQSLSLGEVEVKEEVRRMALER